MESVFRVYALRYATRALANEPLFLGSNVTCGRMDYFTWLAVDEHSGRAIVIDTGFSDQAGAARGRTALASPTELLRDVLGVAPEAVDTLILTHLHYDHTGRIGDFPAARIYVQGEEVRFWTGPLASRPLFRSLVEIPDLACLIERNIQGRVESLEGSQPIADGIRVHKVGGHTPGLQVVTLRTHVGTVVLAGDAMHYRLELEQDLIFNLVTDVAESYQALSTVRQLTDHPELIVPGHDPAVMESYPLVGGSDLVVRVA